MDNVIQLLKTRTPKCTFLTLELDLSEESSCTKLVSSHISHHGTLDTLVLNHATQEIQTDFMNISSEQWLNTFSVNIHPYFYISKAALPHMPKGGTITMNASVNPFVGHPKLIDYTATKGAMVAFARALSNSVVGEKGIRVNGMFVVSFALGLKLDSCFSAITVVAPGPIWTPLM